jgi:hypothetical protein
MNRTEAIYTEYLTLPDPAKHQMLDGIKANDATLERVPYRCPNLFGGEHLEQL